MDYLNKIGLQYFFNKLKDKFVIKEKTFEGENITLTDCSEYPLINLKVAGKTAQDGTPSLDNKAEIKNVKGSIEIKNVGKNLLNVTAVNKSYSEGITITVNEDKSITINGTNNGSDTLWFRLADNFVLSAGNYTLSNKNSNTSGTSFIFMDDARNFPITNIGNATFTEDTTIKPYLKIDKGATVNNQTIYPMIVKGTYTEETIPEYEAYKFKNKTFQLGEERLMEGSYLAEDGIHHKRKQIVYNGTENWELRTDISVSSGYYTFKNNDALKNEFITNGDGLSNYFEIVKSLDTTKNNIRFSSAKGYGAMICIDGNIAKTSKELKTWLSEHNIIIEYELEAEVVEPYTIAQKNAWNTLTKLQMYKGINNIVATSDELSPVVSGTYYTNFKGSDATINGKNILTIETNRHIVMKQTENKLIFSLDIDLDTILERLNKLEALHSKIELNGNVISYKPTETATYDLYYADENGTALTNYDKICSFSATADTTSSYSDFNELNVAPSEAKKIIAVKQSTQEKVDEVTLNNTLLLSTKNLGNKLYSVGLLSDIHIDGNGDGDNSDTAQSVTDFQYALDFFQNKENVDFVAICGDLTYYGYEADYTKYKEIVANYPNLPIKTLRGNHECYENGETNHNDSNTLYQTNIGPLYYEFVHDNDVYLFIGMAQESKTNPLNADEIDFLKTKLATYKNQRVFLFMHYYYGETGNINGISTHGQINDSSGTGKQFIDLMKHYRNIVYFSGHTHLDYKMQEFGANANIQKRTDTMCHRVHISSCSKPRTSEDGTSGSATVDFSGSQGCVMDVYTYGIVLRAIDFSFQLYLPIATYWLDTEPIQIADYVEQPSAAITPTMELGSLSRSSGTTNEATDTIRTADFVEVEPSTVYKITNSTSDKTTCILFYDENQNFISNWNGTYSYQYVENGNTITTTSATKYMKARINTSDVTTTLEIEKQ